MIRTIAEDYGLRIDEIMPPDNPKDIGNGEIQGSHPIHGSTTGTNYCINPGKNVWHCFRHSVGGGPLEALAVRERIIDCSEVCQGCLDTHWNEILSCIEKCGYSRQVTTDTSASCEDLIRQAIELLSSRCDGAVKKDGKGFNKLDAIFFKDFSSKEEVNSSEKKKAVSKLKKYTKQLSSLGFDFSQLVSSCKKGSKAKDKPRVAYYGDDERLYLSTWEYCSVEGSESRSFHFCYMDHGEIHQTDTITINGVEVYPQILPVKEGAFIPITGVPTSPHISQSELVSSSALYTLIETHLNQYIDVSDLDLEILIYYVLFTWFYTKTNTVPYIRILGDTGKGKSRILKVIGDLCFYPITAEGASTASGIMRFNEKWHGTLLIDEADLKGNFENEIVKYINLGFEKGKFFIKSDKLNPRKQEIFDPFSPKIFAMRANFKDNATEGRLFSITPHETTRTDIPIILPADYTEQVLILRGIITKWVLHHWADVDGSEMIDVSNLPFEPRLKQLIMPLSIILQLFPDGEKRLLEYLEKRQDEIRKTRSQSFEGMCFNTVLALARGEETPGDEFCQYVSTDGLEVVTPKMVAMHTGVSSPTSVTRALKSIGFDIEISKIDMYIKREGEQKHKKQSVRKLVVPDNQTWLEIVQRYYYKEPDDESAQISLDTINGYPSCPDSLKGRRFLSTLSTVTTHDMGISG